MATDMQSVRESVTDPREPDFEFLDPTLVRLSDDGAGRLRLMVADNRCYLDVKVVRAFPLSMAHSFYGLLDGAGKDRVIGLIVSPDELDPDSRALAEASLQRHYFMPTITKIHSLKEEFGAVYFDVDTDRGRRHFVARGIRDATEESAGGELRLKDADGNRFRVVDWRTLDAKSRRLLGEVI